MIPYPKNIEYKEGKVPKNCRVREQVCPELGEEEYRIHLTPEGAVLEGSGKAGLFYARTTLGQLKLLYEEELPCMEVEDAPAYPYRSFHIDCARHFFDVGELKKIIRMSAEFKLNHFHWHISDDQGFRIECRRYPRLHEVGSVRAGDHFGNYSSDRTEGGYYSQEEVKDIVSFCGELGVTVVPEIDMPGHVLAILAAYPELSCTGESARVATKAGIYPDILCAGKEEVFLFIENLLDELLELFPGRYFHIGGDEAPKVRWNACPLCQKRMEEEHLWTGQELQGYVENRIASYLLGRGRIPIVWNEAAYGGNLEAGTVVQIWTEDRENQIKAHLKKGGRAIVSMVPNSYCDYPYSIHTLKDIYQLNTEPEELGEQARTGILGTECLVWTEYIRDNRRLEEYSFPRFAASAEAGWCGQGRPGYEHFRQRLEKLFPLFESCGVSAAGRRMWVPDAVLSRKLTEEFQANFSEEDKEEARRAQEEV